MDRACGGGEVVIGWVVAADVVDPTVPAVVSDARDAMLTQLQRQLPAHVWRMPITERRVFPPFGALDVMPLMELGSLEKSHHGWDYAIVVVPNELNPRHRAYTMAVPSSALEVAVLSTSRLQVTDTAAALAALALHTWGHLAGLGHSDAGPMRPPESPETLRVEPFPDEQVVALSQRLAEVADARLEEQDRRWSLVRFWLRVLMTDPRATVRAVSAYRPWLMPLYLGRLTAASAVSTVFLLLTADAWQAGVALSAPLVHGTSVVAVVAATFFIFVGQNIGQVGRGLRRTEQAVRSRIVMFLTLLVGLSALWLVLLAVARTATLLVPESVAADWTGRDPGTIPTGRYAAFVSTMGVVAAALGGNLEEEDELKAELLFDEET